jgi:hypothetical protein
MQFLNYPAHRNIRLPGNGSSPLFHTRRHILPDLVDSTSLKPLNLKGINVKTSANIVFTSLANGNVFEATALPELAARKVLVLIPTHVLV